MVTTLNELAELQRVELGRTRYVIVEETVFDRLCDAAAKSTGGVESSSVGRLSPFAADPGMLARRLLTRRRQAGVSQAELARQAGIRVETLNRIERGKTSPDYATIRKLVVALNGGQRARH